MVKLVARCASKPSTTGSNKMRLWSLHPKYLDPQGLVALWREGLLARAVLRGETKGYRHHPQLARFASHASPRSAINAYLRAVYEEAVERGYEFDRRKIGPSRSVAQIAVPRGQLLYEWQHSGPEAVGAQSGGSREMARHAGARQPSVISCAAGARRGMGTHR